MASIDEKIADLKAKITRPKLEDPRLDFKPDGRFYRVLPGDPASLIGETFIPWSGVTPVGRRARLPKDFVGHPLQIAFGWIRWTDTVTYQFRPERTPVVRDTPLLLADAVANRGRDGFEIIGPVTANTLLLKWIERNGGTATLSDDGSFTTDFFPYERIDSIVVGRFIVKNAHLARAFDMAATKVSKGLSILLGETVRTYMHLGTVRDPDLDSDQRSAIQSVIEGTSIAVHGAPGCGKTRAIVAMANAIAEEERPVAIASPVPGALASVRRMLDNPHVRMIDLSRGETAVEDVTLLIIDEASSITPLQAAPLAARANQLVVVGDPNQSPPSSALPRIDGEESLMTWALSLSSFKKHHLKHHYRSPHCEVIDLSNMEFYDSKIRMVPAPWWHPLDGMHVHHLQSAPYDGPVHKGEAERALEIARRIRAHDASRSILVITMNAKQRAEIAKRFDAAGPLYADIDVVYVRDAQGNEADDVIVSLVPAVKSGLENHPDSFEDRLINVAFSRARRSNHAIIGPKANEAMHPLMHYYLQMFRVPAHAGYQLDEPKRSIEYGRQFFKTQDVHGCNLGVVIGITPAGKNHWDAGLLKANNNYWDYFEYKAIQDMLVKKGWNLIR